MSGSFFVNMSNDAPTVPVINSPVVGSEVATTPVLTVNNATDLEGDSLSYIFEIDTVDTFNSGGKQTSGLVTEGSSTTSWTPAALSDNTMYYWRVKANDGATDSAFMTASFFVNTANDAPSTPTLNNPSDGAEVTTLPPPLVVNASSDIDLCLIIEGNIFNENNFISKIDGLEKTIFREVNYIYYSEEEWEKQINDAKRKNNNTPGT